jgi:nicotinamide-nucleotide amidase
MIDLAKAKEALQFLEKEHWTLGSAESLTGGLFASTICSVPGASKVFKGAIVSYAASVKEDILKVSADDIAKFGVVSEPVAIAMAEGAINALKVNVAVSFTGNAGPTAEPGEAPVGQVNMALALALPNQKVIITAYEKHFTGARNAIREASVSAMIDAIIALQNTIVGHK